MSPTAPDAVFHVEEFRIPDHPTMADVVTAVREAEFSGTFRLGPATLERVSLDPEAAHLLRRAMIEAGASYLDGERDRYHGATIETGRRGVLGVWWQR